MCIWIKWNTKNASNLEESADMFELSEEEEISCIAEQKRPRGSQTCLTLTSRVSSDTFTIFMIVIF